MIGSIVKNTRFLLLVLSVVLFNLAAFAGSVVFYHVPVWAVLSVIVVNVVMMVGISHHTTVLEPGRAKPDFALSIR